MSHSTFSIGDKVRAIAPSCLHCGSGIYSHAIVVATDPLALVSPGGDMLWRDTVDGMNLEYCGGASFDEYYPAIGRYAFELGLPKRNWKPLAVKDESRSETELRFRDGLLKLLDGCFCDDYGQPECPRCTRVRNAMSALDGGKA